MWFCHSFHNNDIGLVLKGSLQGASAILRFGHHQVALLLKQIFQFFPELRVRICQQDVPSKHSSHPKNSIE